MLCILNDLIRSVWWFPIGMWCSQCCVGGFWSVGSSTAADCLTMNTVALWWYMLKKNFLYYINVLVIFSVVEIVLPFMYFYGFSNFSLKWKFFFVCWKSRYYVQLWEYWSSVSFFTNLVKFFHAFCWTGQHMSQCSQYRGFHRHQMWCPETLIFLCWIKFTWCVFEESCWFFLVVPLMYRKITFSVDSSFYALVAICFLLLSAAWIWPEV